METHMKAETGFLLLEVLIGIALSIVVMTSALYLYSTTIALYSEMAKQLHEHDQRVSNDE